MIIFQCEGALSMPLFLSLSLTHTHTLSLSLSLYTSLFRYDPRHWLGNLFAAVASKTCALFGVFAIACSMCLFKPVAEDYGKVISHIKYMCPDITDEQIPQRFQWRYFRRRVRQICPDPMSIMIDLLDVFDVFSMMVDPTTKRRFFLPVWKTILKKQMKYIALGLLSDTPGLPMYV